VQLTHTETAVGVKMADCTDRGCKQRLEETHDAVFKDSSGGCRFDISWIKRNLIGKKLALTCLIVFGLPSYYAMINVWAGDKSDKDKIQVITDRQNKVIEQNIKQDERLIRLEEQYCTIRDDLKSLKEQQKSDTKEILNAIHQNKRGTVTDRGY
jgi:hypothetical protein